MTRASTPAVEPVRDRAKEVTPPWPASISVLVFIIIFTMVTPKALIPIARTLHKDSIFFIHVTIWMARDPTEFTKLHSTLRS
jgi:hypothetical protein